MHPVRLDLPDLVQFVLGTRVRIGEAAAVRDSVMDLDAGFRSPQASDVGGLGRDWRVADRPGALYLGEQVPDHLHGDQP